MPQMNPMNWMILTNTSILFVMILATQIYFTKTTKSTVFKVKKISKSWLW